MPTVRSTGARALLMCSLALWLALSCQVPTWRARTFPRNGATDVRPDDVLELHLVAMPADVPSLNDAICLSRDGRPVRFETEIDAERDVVFVFPIEPLEPGIYAFSGVDLDAHPHWDGVVEGFAAIRFSVGGDLGYLVSAEPRGDRLVVGFSEAVDPTELVGRLDVGDQPYEVVGHREDRDWQVELEVEDVRAVEAVTVIDPIPLSSGRVVEASDTIDVWGYPQNSMFESGRGCE